MEELKKNYRESLIKFKELKDLIQNKMGEITNKIEKFTEKKIKELMALLTLRMNPAVKECVSILSSEKM